ncbi:hypothetical protein Tco_0632762 [Tanacetum coccineum]
MKTKRKLVPNTYPLTGDDNIVSFNVDHHVYDGNLNMSPKKQCLNGPNFISSSTVDVSSSGIQNMTPISGTTVLNTDVNQPIATLHQDDVVPDTECQIPSHSVTPTTISRESRANRRRTKHNRPVTGGSSSQQASSSGPPPEYKYLGSCTHACEHSGALFWFEERLKSTPTCSLPRYNRCCKAGRVALRTYQIYPEYIKLLLGDCHFLENIRAYNQMFSMTSLRANIDESINNGRGPYVFKIFGQLYHWIGSLCPADREPPRFLQLYISDTDNEVDNHLSHYRGDNSVLRKEIVEGLIDLLDTHNALV